MDNMNYLQDTTDAMVWAEAWCKIAREIQADPERGGLIDEAWMVGWFANAMEVARRAGQNEVTRGVRPC